MEKHIKFLRFIAFILFMGFLYFVFRAYDTGWIFNVSIGTFFLLALAISTVVYFFIGPALKWLFTTKDKK